MSSSLCESFPQLPCRQRGCGGITKNNFFEPNVDHLREEKKYGLVLCYGSQHVFLCAHDPDTLLSSDCGRLGKLGPHKILHSRSKKTAVFSCPESPALPQVHDFTTAPDARW